MSLRFMVFYKNRAGKTCFRIVSATEVTRESTEFTILEGNPILNEINSLKILGIAPLHAKEGSHLSTSQQASGKVYLTQMEKDVWRFLQEISVDPELATKFYNELKTSLPGVTESKIELEKFDANVLPESFITNIANDEDRHNVRRQTWTVQSIRDEINFSMNRYEKFIREIKQGKELKSVYEYICMNETARYHSEDKKYDLYIALLVLKGMLFSQDLYGSADHDDVLVHSETTNYWDVSDEAIQKLGNSLQQTYTAMGIKHIPWTVADVRKEMQYCFLNYRDLIFDNVKNGITPDKTLDQIIQREKTVAGRGSTDSIPFTIAISRLGEYAHPRR